MCFMDLLSTNNRCLPYLKDRRGDMYLKAVQSNEEPPATYAEEYEVWGWTHFRTLVIPTAGLSEPIHQIIGQLVWKL